MPMALANKEYLVISYPFGRFFLNVLRRYPTWSETAENEPEITEKVMLFEGANKNKS